MLTVQGGVFYGWKKSAQAAQSGAPKDNGFAVLLAAFGCGVGKLYAAVGGVCVFADAYGAAAGPRAADGLYGSCSGGGSIRSSSVASVQGRSCFCAGWAAVCFTACLLGASLLAGGEVNWQGSNVMLPIALLLGGLLGSAVTALRTNR